MCLSHDGVNIQKYHNVRFTKKLSQLDKVDLFSFLDGFRWLVVGDEIGKQRL
jgi:hypothetical protein